MKPSFDLERDDVNPIMQIDLERIFDDALQLEDSRQRAEFLDRACAGDLALRKRVDSLLRAYSASDYLDSTPQEVASILNENSPSDLAGGKVGPYVLLELLGEGGMGEVYLAERYDGGKPNQVAVKFIKPGMDSRQVLARYQLEQEALKRLDHPHIAKFVDSGITDGGRLYFAMELVEGIPLTHYCDRQRLSIGKRLKLLITTCHAVEHAHEKGIVHRDLKPANVLVTVVAGQPLVKVIDFGISKALAECATDPAPHTRATQFIGTPGYMSPEQSRWSSDVDLRTDVYSLGAVLYKLLTGATPIPREVLSDSEPTELRHRIQTEEPPWPSQRLARLTATELDKVCISRSVQPRPLLRTVRGDLDWIALKALKLNRNERYTSPRALAADLNAYLENRTISARRPSLASHLSKWAKRNATALKITLSVALLAGLVIGLLWVNRRLQDAQLVQHEIQATNARIAAESLHREFVRDVQDAHAFLHAGDNSSALQLLNKYSQASGEPYAENFAINYLRSQIPKQVQVLEGHQHDLLDIDLSADQKWLVSSDRGGDIIIWDLASGSEVHRLHPEDAEVTRCRFSPTGNLLATTGQGGKIRLWNVGDWSPAGELSRHLRTVNGLDWSVDGRYLASGDRNGDVYIWDVESRSRLRTLPKHSGSVRCLAWSPDGKSLVTANGDTGVSLWDCGTWEQQASIANNNRGTLAIAFSADNHFMAFGGYYNELTIYDLSAQTVVQRSQTHSAILSLAFGNRNELLVGSGDAYAQVYEYSRRSLIWKAIHMIQVNGLGSNVRGIACAEGKKRICFACEQERSIRVLTSHVVNGYHSDQPKQIPIGMLLNCNLILAADQAGDNGMLQRADNGALVHQLPFRLSRYCRPEYATASDVIALAGVEGNLHQVILIQAVSGVELARLTFPARIRWLSFSRDGENLAASGEGGLVRIWNLSSQTFHDLSEGNQGESFVAPIAFSPTSDQLVLNPVHAGNVVCLRSGTFEEVSATKRNYDVQSLLYHPQGDFLVIGNFDRVAVWASDLSEMLWSSTRTLTDDFSRIESIQFSPDLSLIVALNEDGNVGFWDVRTHSKLFSILMPDLDDGWIAFADSETLLLGGPTESSIYSLHAPHLNSTHISSTNISSTRQRVGP